MIVVTGCCSRLAIDLIKKLKSDKFKVRGIDLCKSSHFPDNIDFIKSDLSDYDTLTDALKKVDTIIHMMDMRYPGKFDRKLMKEMNINGTENLLKASVESGVKKVIFLSTAEVYGKPTGIPVKESDRLKPLTTYGKDKKAAENICNYYGENFNLDITILRIPPMIYPGTHDPLTLALLHNALTRGYTNKVYISRNFSTHMPLLHSDDLIDGLLKVVKSGKKNKIYNLSSDNVPTHIEQIVEVKKKCNLDFHIALYNPFLLRRPLIRFLKNFGKIHLRRALKYLMTTDLLLDTDSIKRDLKWYPTKNNLDIMSETINWYKNSGIDLIKDL